MTTTNTTLGVTVATNIGRHMDRLGWEFDDLAVATGLEWHDLIDHRADASNMGLPILEVVAEALEVVAEALGVSPIDLTKSS